MEPWLEALKLAGTAAIPSLILAFVVFTLFKTILPGILADHRAAQKEQSDAFLKASEQQRQDFLQALRDRDAAETARAERSAGIFERRLEAHSNSCTELVRVQAASFERAVSLVTDDLKALKAAILQNGELLIATFEEAFSGERHEPTQQDLERRGARHLLQSRESEKR